MRQVDAIVVAKGTNRHTALYFCLIVATAIFIFLYSSPISSRATAFFSRIQPLKQYFETTEQADEPPEVVHPEFLVYSENCKIPNLNPFHPSIKHLIEYSEPIKCSDYAPFSTTKHNLLLFNYEVAEARGIKSFSCCYKVLSRERDGESDNSYRLTKECVDVKNGSIIPEEFISIECKHTNGSTFYKDFHSFIHDKRNVEKRCKNSAAKYSVLIIGVDAVSRLNMHRQLNKTSEYLLNHMGAMEMYGFTKVGDNTFPNLVPLLLGYDERELPKVCWNSSSYHLDSCDFMWNHFKNKGYRTLYAEDSPYISSFNYQKRGFAYQPTDYYFRNFIQAYEDALGREKPLNCYLCVGSVSETEAVLQWLEKFVVHFRDRPYFAFAWINSLTHDFLNMGSKGDHLYEAFFRNLHRSGTLNNTIIILMGDHGMRWGEIRTTYIGRLEERMPMLMIVLPDKFKREYPSLTEILQKNRHRLVTPFDLHATLDNIVHIDEGWTDIDTINVTASLKNIVAHRSRSLFTPIPLNRTCKEAYIDEHWCTCEMSLPADVKNDDVKLIAMFLINEINKILKKHRKVCARLHLASIEQARLWSPLNDKISKRAQTSTYTVVIKATPGRGLFEGTARLKMHKSFPELLGSISRLNLYGNQSSCVHDAILNKYCYCI